MLRPMTLTWIDTSRLEPVGRSYTVRAVSGSRAAALTRTFAHRDGQPDWRTAPILYISEPDLDTGRDATGFGLLTYEYEIVIQTGWKESAS